VQPALFAGPTPATAEGRRLLEILARWSTEPKPARRLRVDLDADLAWFTRHVLAAPEHAGVPVLEALNKWDLYLEDQHRKAEAGQRSTFPKVWKTSLLRALGFAREDEARRAERAAARASGEPPPVATRPDPHRRGAHAETPQPFEIPVVQAKGSMDDWEESAP